MNESVVDKAIMAALRLNCKIQKINKFDRKNYFYPDLPKGYQISQLFSPIGVNGSIKIGEKEIRIIEMHIEEDAGKLIHSADGKTLIDYNRCGVPLIEIVTAPDFESSQEVVAFLEWLKETMLFSGISDCKMQEGSMRADVNVSVRKSGDNSLGTRTEMKNLSSFRNIALAIDYEAKRQISELEADREIKRETRRWDEDKQVSIFMRSKEGMGDYKFFPEPDIPPVCIDDERIERIRSSLPETADEKRKRYISVLGLSEYEAGVLTSDKNLCDFFDAVNEDCGEVREACNLALGEAAAFLKGDEDKIYVSSQKAGALIRLLKQNKINRTVYKEVFGLIQESKGELDGEKYIIENNLLMQSNADEMEEIIDEILSVNTEAVSDYKNGKKKAFGFLMGEAMKKSNSKGNPSVISEILKRKLDN